MMAEKRARHAGQLAALQVSMHSLHSPAPIPTGEVRGGAGRRVCWSILRCGYEAARGISSLLARWVLSLLTRWLSCTFSYDLNAVLSIRVVCMFIRRQTHAKN